MSLLVDTHIFLWFESNSAKLRPNLRKTLVDPEQRVYLSAVSFWEIAIKRRTGKLAMSGAARAAAIAAGFETLAIGAADAEMAGALDWPHRDPFDRMLVAQCLNHAMTLVTADAALRVRADIAVLWAG